jgi:hypothetical protein
MDVNQETKDAILTEVGPLIGSALAAGLVAAAATAVLGLIATNDETDTMVGKQETHPTANGTSISKVGVAGTETGGKLADDKVAAVEGEVKASETDGTASATEATAAESGASAARTKAGASDIETKALKIT